MSCRILFAPLLLLVLGTPLLAQLAPRPPMGWNSWDSFGTTVTAAQVRAVARFMARRLRRYGWSYVVVDEGWYLGAHGMALDGYGRFVPDPNRFPAAAGGAGFQPLAAYVHSLGLRFGIHILRGIPRAAVARGAPIAGSPYRAAQAAVVGDTCPWNSFNYGVNAASAAGQAYYRSLARQYARWGVDFVKADCIASHPYRGGEIRALAAALRATGRPIVLSLSPGPAPLARAAELAGAAQMWRISEDVWDLWRAPGDGFPQGVANQFSRAAAWERWAGPGHWPDADMLPIGPLRPHPGWGPPRDSRLRPAERRTMFTAWCMFRSPLMVGGNLPLASRRTLALFTDPEVIAVDQRSTGNHEVASGNPDVSIWLARPAQGRGYYLAVFNLGAGPRRLRYSWRSLGLPRRAYRMRDLWARRGLGVAARLQWTLAGHASALWRLSPRNLAARRCNFARERQPPRATCRRQAHGNGRRSGRIRVEPRTRC